MINIKLQPAQQADSPATKVHCHTNLSLSRALMSLRFVALVWFWLLLLAAPALLAQNTTPAPANKIGIDITTYLGDKQTFKQGDTLAFLVNLDKAAHVLLVYQDAANNLIQIIPNRYRPQDHYPAGLFIAVPSDKEPFEFTVKPPFGEEKLWAFASQDQFPELEGEELGNGLKKLSGNLATILRLVRPSKHGAIYGEASTTIITVAK